MNKSKKITFNIKLSCVSHCYICYNLPEKLLLCKLCYNFFCDECSCSHNQYVDSVCYNCTNQKRKTNLIIENIRNNKINLLFK